MNRSPLYCYNGNAPETSLEDLVNGNHENCQNPTCRMPFPFGEGKLVRVRGLDSRWYCDSHCASGPYLTPRRYSGC
jgi:hypothetical protein